MTRILRLAALLSILSPAGLAAAQGGWAEEAERPSLPAEPEPAEELAPEDVVLDEAEIQMVPEDRPQGRVRIGVMAGWGSAIDRPNPWGIGVGVHGGYTLESGWHVGAKFLYFLGEVSGAVFDFGIEGGHAFQVGRLNLVPTLGTGFVVVTLGDRSSPEFYLSPGSYVLFDLDDFYLGVDGRCQIVFTNDPYAAAVVMAVIGLRY